MPFLKQKHAHKAHNHADKHRHHGKAALQRSIREREMITNRVTFVTIGVVASYLLDAIPTILTGFLVYLIASLAIALAYRINPKSNKMRLLSGLFADFGFGILIFGTGGGSVAVVYPLYLWVILGYGFRFGIPWLISASIMAAASFGWVIFNVEYWQENRSLSLGLWIGLLVIPGYCSTLIVKISQAKEEAEAANKAKSLFLANISHELRTPLNAIIGYGTHLLEMKLPQNQHKMIATSVSAGRHLLHLINQLLNFAQSESREEPPEPRDFSITDILAEVRDIMQIAADEKGLQIHLQADPLSERLIAGQVDYIRNILINLTSNAVKFTETGTIILRCGIRGRNQDLKLWCSVTDTGPGIPEGAQKKIFEVFQQADDSVISKFGGTGLGLAICRQLAVQMGGDVTVQSELGVGSTFAFACPVDLAEEENITEVSGTYRLLSLGLNNSGPIISNCKKHRVDIVHIQCDKQETAQSIIERCDEGDYELAMIDQELADQFSEKSDLWKYFDLKKLAPVLVEPGKPKTIEEMRLRAAFASVIPAAPDFGTIRSVVQIGCSFSGSDDQSEEIEEFSEKDNPAYHILVADDNRTNQMVLETILSNAGHQVTVVPDGEKALEELEANRFDMVFLDVNMPKVGGIECCKLWRQIEGPREHIPVIGLTADSTDETEKKCLDAGMDLRLTKPIESGPLLDVIAKQTGQRASPRAKAALSDPFGVVTTLNADDSASLPPPIDPQQLEYLLSIGDEEFVQSIVDVYIEDAAEILTAFKTSVDDQNIKDFRFHAHAFKSGANNVGANKLSEMCGRLEVVTQPDFISRRVEYLAQVSDEVKRICDYLGTEHQRTGSDNQTQTSETKARQ